MMKNFQWRIFAPHRNYLKSTINIKAIKTASYTKDKRVINCALWCNIIVVRKKFLNNNRLKKEARVFNPFIISCFYAYEWMKALSSEKFFFRSTFIMRWLFKRTSSLIKRLFCSSSFVELYWVWETYHYVGDFIANWVLPLKLLK